MVKKFPRIIAGKPEERDPTGYFDIYGRIIFNLFKYFVCTSKSANKICYI